MEDSIRSKAKYKLLNPHIDTMIQEHLVPLKV